MRPLWRASVRVIPLVPSEDANLWTQLRPANSSLTVLRQGTLG